MKNWHSTSNFYFISKFIEVLDEGSTIVIIMLDLSEAFDVIDHSIVMNYLEYSFGIKVNALDWVRSYLSDRIQCVWVDDTTSPDLGVHFGVPQRSVWGPKNYCMHIKSVGNIIKRHNIKYPYRSLKPCDKWDDISFSIEAWFADMSIWMNNNMRKIE